MGWLRKIRNAWKRRRKSKKTEVSETQESNPPAQRNGCKKTHARAELTETSRKQQPLYTDGTRRSRSVDCLLEEGRHAPVDPHSLQGAASAMYPHRQQHREESVPLYPPNTKGQQHQQPRLTQPRWQRTDCLPEQGSHSQVAPPQQPQSKHPPLRRMCHSRTGYEPQFWSTECLQEEGSNTRPVEPYKHTTNSRQQQQQYQQPSKERTGQNDRAPGLQSWRSTDCVLDGGDNTLVAQTQHHYSNTRQLQQYNQATPSKERTDQNYRAPGLQSWRNTDCVLDGGSSTVVPQTQDHYSNTRQKQQQYQKPGKERTDQNYSTPGLQSWRSTDCMLDGGSSTVVPQTQDHYSNTRQHQQQYQKPGKERTDQNYSTPGLQSWRSTDCMLDGGSSTVVPQTQDHYSNTRQHQQQYQKPGKERTDQNYSTPGLQSWRSTDCMLDGGSSTVVPQTQDHYSNTRQKQQQYQQSRQERTWQSPKEQDVTYRGSTDGLSPEGGHVPVESPTPDHDNYSKWGPGATRTRPTQPPHQQPRLTKVPYQSPTGNKVRGSELQSWRSTDCVLDGGSNSLVATSPDHYRNTRILQQNYQQPRQERTPGQKHRGPKSHCNRSTDCLLEAGCNSLVAPSLDHRSNTRVRQQQHQQPRQETSPGQYSGSCDPQSRGSTTCLLEGMKVSMQDPCSNTMSPRWQPQYQQRRQEQYRRAGQEQYRQAGQEQYRQAGQEQYRQAGQEQYRQAGQEQYRQAGQQQYRQAVQEQFRQAGQEQFRQAGQEQFRQQEQEQYRQAGQEQYQQAGQEQYRQAGQEQYQQAGQQQYRKPRKEQSHLQLEESPYRREGSNCSVESPPDHYKHSSWEQGILNNRPQQWHKQQHQRTGRTPAHKPTGPEPRTWRSTERLLEEDSHADVASPPDLYKYPKHGSGGTCRLPPIGTKPRGHELQSWRSMGCLLEGRSNVQVQPPQDPYGYITITTPQQHQDQQTRLTRIQCQSSRGWEPLSPRSTDSGLLDSSLDPYGNTKQVCGAMSTMPQQQQYQQPTRTHASHGQASRDLDHRHWSSTGCLLEEASNALVTSTQGRNNLIQTNRPEQQRYQQSRLEITLHQSPTSREPQTSRSTDCLDGRGSKAAAVSSHLPHKYTNHGSAMSSLPPTQLQVPRPTTHRSPMHSPRYHKTPAWRSLDCLLEEGHPQETYNDVSQHTGSRCSTSPCPQPRDEGRDPHWSPQWPDHPPKKHTYAAWGTRYHQDNHCK